MVRRSLPGESTLKPRTTRDENTIERSAEHYAEREELSPGGSPRKRLIRPDIIRIKNNTGIDLDRGHCVQFNERHLEELEPDQIWIEATLPSFGRRSYWTSTESDRNSHGILRSPIKSGQDEVVECNIDGGCLAKIDVSNVNHRYVEIQEDNPVFQSCFADGFAEIIESPTTTGEQELAVRIQRHGVYPPIEALVKELIYETADPWGDATAYKFSNDEPGEFRFESEDDAAYPLVGDYARSGVVRIQDQSSIADEYNGAALILKQGWWRMSFVAVVDSLLPDSGLVESDFYETVNCGGGVDASTTIPPYNHSHTDDLTYQRFRGDILDVPYVTVSVRHPDVHAVGVWLALRNFGQSMRIDIQSLLGNTGTRDYVEIGKPMLFPLSRDDYQLKFRIELADSAFDHTGILDLHKTRIVLQRISAIPQSYYYTEFDAPQT